MWPFSTLVRDSVPDEVRSAIDFSAFSDMFAPSYSGVAVNETNAVNLPAVYKCVSLNAETISSLPIDVYAKRGSTRVEYMTPAWVQSPNPLQTMAEFIAMTQTSLDLSGNAYWMKISSGNKIVGLQILAPSAVQPELIGGKVVYWVGYADGVREPFSSSAIVHLRGLTLPGSLVGLSPIACAKQTIGIGLAAEQFGAQFFGNGATLSGVITAPGTMTQEQADRLKESFTKRHGGISRSHAIGVLSGGSAWQPLSVNPEEAQFLASRAYAATEIANLYGVPPELVSSDATAGAKGYVTALSMRMRLWHITGLNPRLVRIENALTSLVPRGVYVKFNRNALLQMDPAERTAFYAAGQLGEYLTRNEIRAYEDLNPVPGGDEFLHSVQWQENSPEDPEPPEEPDADEPDDEGPDGPLFDGGTQ